MESFKRPSKADILSVNEITYELLHDWFVKDTNSMHRLHQPVTKIKQIMKIWEDKK